MLGSSQVFSTMPAVDIQRAVDFYTRVLGLKYVQIPDAEDGAMFEAGSGTSIFLYEREATKAEHTAATFSVDDIESIVEGLAGRGVIFEQYDLGEIKTDQRGIAVMGDTKAAWFKDSEGNIIAVMSQT